MRCIWFFLIITLQWGCVSPPGLKPLGEKAVSLQLKGGQSTTHSYSSISNSKFYEQGELVREKQDAVDFTVQTEFLGVEGKGFSFNVKTIKKEGTVLLNGLGFPELGEVIKMTYGPEYKVLNVVGKPRGGLFYVPPVSLPKKNVKKGDTWILSAEWEGKNKLPLQINIVSILKNRYLCPVFGECVEIEISGHVNVKNDIKMNVKLLSKVRGRFLLNLNNADVIWSEVGSQEWVYTKSGRIEVNSCVASKIHSEKALFLNSTPLSCDPISKESGPLPGL